MLWLPYQKNWINDESRLKILVKSRRIGGSYSTSYAIWRRLMKQRNHDIVVVTRDENLATEFIADVTKWIRLWNIANPTDIVPEKCMKRLSLELPHSNGPTRLIAVSSNPDAAAGKGGDLIIDEMALHKNQDLLMRVAKPIITAGGNLTVLSTHRSKNSLFNQIAKEAQLPESEWSYHKTDILEAVDQGFLEFVVNPTMIKLGNEPYKNGQEYIAWLMSIYDEYTWSQEFMCMPSEEAFQLLKEQEIDDAVEKYEKQTTLSKGLTYVGWDLAQSVHGDFATFCVINAYKHEVEVIHYEYLPKGTKIEDQMEMVQALAKQYKAHKIVADATGLGTHPVSVLQGKLGELNVIAFQANMKSKADMCTKAKRYFQNRQVRMPKNKMLKDDFESMERVISPSGNVLYVANYSNGSHADMFSAFAMALSEVPENSEIKMGILKATKPGNLPLDPMFETITQQIERNRREDRKSKKRKRNKGF